MKTAQGYARAGDDRSAIRRIVVSFDTLTFAEISVRARSRNQSFAQSVRELVELGMETELDDN